MAGIGYVASYPGSKGTRRNQSDHGKDPLKIAVIVK